MSRIPVVAHTRVCGGPRTNVAQALRQAPDIATRLTLVWIGGALDPDAFEGGAWPLGDSPPVLVTALTTDSSTSTVSGRRRVYTDVDTRLLLADLLAELRIHGRTTDDR